MHCFFVPFFWTFFPAVVNFFPAVVDLLGLACSPLLGSVRGRASKSRPTLVSGLVVLWVTHSLYVAQHYCLHHLHFSVPLCVSKYSRPS